MPMPPTWCWWLKGIGWSRTSPARVTYPERLISRMRYSAPATRKAAPKMLTFESVLVLRWKTCATLGPVQAIAEIAQARQDVLAVVELAVHRRRVQGRVGDFRLQPADPLRSGHDREHAHAAHAQLAQRQQRHH